MPGLIRGVARTAVIAGTASATVNAVNRRQAKKNVAAYEGAQQAYAQEQYQQQAAAAPQQAAYAPQPPPVYEPTPAPVAAEPEMDDKISQLERLAQLKAQGILTEEEFAQQKMKILG